MDPVKHAYRGELIVAIAAEILREYKASGQLPKEVFVRPGEGLPPSISVELIGRDDAVIPIKVRNNLGLKVNEFALNYDPEA